MARHVHVHLHTQDADDKDGRWVTINGARVFIGKGGKIEKGPAALVGKTHGQAGASAHGAEHERLKHANPPAASAHKDAGGHYANAHRAAEPQEAAHHIRAGEGAAARAKELEGRALEKPKAHQKLHAEAEKKTAGSPKHAEEHKRLMGLYNAAKSDSSRSAANRQIERNLAHFETGGTFGSGHGGAGKERADMEHRRQQLQTAVKDDPKDERLAGELRLLEEKLKGTK